PKSPNTKKITTGQGSQGPRNLQSFGFFFRFWPSGIFLAFGLLEFGILNRRRFSRRRRILVATHNVPCNQSPPDVSPPRRHALRPPEPVPSLRSQRDPVAGALPWVVAQFRGG